VSIAAVLLSDRRLFPDQKELLNAFTASPLRANLTGDPARAARERTTARSFNTDGFEQPRAFVFGTSPRGLLRGTGDVTVDLLLLKGDAPRAESAPYSFAARHSTRSIT
jgi:hypothetical protein